MSRINFFSGIILCLNLLLGAQEISIDQDLKGWTKVRPGNVAQDSAERIAT